MNLIGCVMLSIKHTFNRICVCVNIIICSFVNLIGCVAVNQKYVIENVYEFQDQAWKYIKHDTDLQVHIAVSTLVCCDQPNDGDMLAYHFKRGLADYLLQAWYHHYQTWLMHELLTFSSEKLCLQQKSHIPHE